MPYVLKQGLCVGNAHCEQCGKLKLNTLKYSLYCNAFQHRIKDLKFLALSKNTEAKRALYIIKTHFS